MKKAFIITSAIEVNNKFPLTYSDKRSFFNTEERLRQTVMTLASLDGLCDKDTYYYVLDVSNEWHSFAELLHYQKNLRFISVKERFPEIFEEVTTHPHKTVCESTILATFMRNYRAELSQYDFVFKMTGRYFLDSSFDTSIFTETNKDKIFYKRPLEFEWKDEWNYHMVDRRREQGTNTLRQYCSVLFGWGQSHYDHFLDMFTAVPSILKQPAYSHLDIETFGHYFTRPYESDIIETGWLVYGWDGATGRFWRY